MKTEVTVLAIVGTYRKGGTVDTVVDQILESARMNGATTRKIDLIDQHIEFCTNCRTCAQEKGPERGKCIHQDDMESILEEIEKADAIVLGSPMNFGTVTAVTKRFIERLMCLAYWPWGKSIPKVRSANSRKPAVLVGSCSAPAIFLHWPNGMMKLLRQTVNLLGAHPVGELRIGLAAKKGNSRVTPRIRARASDLGRLLVSKANGRLASKA